MSMNLYAETKDGKEVKLWQTPTWITDCCLVGHDDKIRKWKDTRHLYSEWVRSHTQGRFESEEESQNERDRVSRHLKDLYSHKRLNFYML